MEMITVSAKTEDEATIKAAMELQTTRDKLEYEVIDKGSAGFLGIGARPVIIRAKKKMSLEDIAVDFLTQLFDTMSMTVEISASYNEEEKELAVNMEGQDMGVLIGKRGQTLDSLQYLVSLVVNKNKENEGHIRVKLDTENYRERRKETLETLAKNIAYKVKRTKRPVALEPMNPYERRIIHSSLQNDKYVTTKSEGEEPFRHVVIFLKKEGSRRGGRYNEPASSQQ